MTDAEATMLTVACAREGVAVPVAATETVAWADEVGTAVEDDVFVAPGDCECETVERGVTDADFDTDADGVTEGDVAPVGVAGAVGDADGRVDTELGGEGDTVSLETSDERIDAVPDSELEERNVGVAVGVNPAVGVTDDLPVLEIESDAKRDALNEGVALTHAETARVTLDDKETAIERERAPLRDGFKDTRALFETLPLPLCDFEKRGENVAARELDAVFVLQIVGVAVREGWGGLEAVTDPLSEREGRGVADKLTLPLSVTTRDGRGDADTDALALCDFVLKMETEEDGVGESDRVGAAPVALSEPLSEGVTETPIDRLGCALAVALDESTADGVTWLLGELPALIVKGTLADTCGLGVSASVSVSVLDTVAVPITEGDAVLDTARL